MYEMKFGLTANPFGMTPDPEFFYQSTNHREALAALSYGVEMRRGFMTLVGEVGTGKTTLITTLLGRLERSTCTIMVTHTTVDREELLRAIVHKMHRLDSVRTEGGRPGRGGSSTVRQLADMSRIELINEFSSFVNGEFMAFRPPPLLLIDEAQNLAPDVLEEIRLLTNLEGPKSKLVQVILSGQPELGSLLGRNDLRQLHQRIAVRAVLKPLSCAETEEYVAFRLNQAGAEGREIFTPDAMQAIWAASGGVPRTINVLCDYSLVNALGTGADQVTWALVDEAIQDVLSVGERIPEPAMSIGERWDDEATSPSGSGPLHWAEEPLVTKPKPYVLTQPGRATHEPANRGVAAGGEHQEPRGE